jgi:tRNA U38,U39,U40 pseudouridine synthase TruA
VRDAINAHPAASLPCWKRSTPIQFHARFDATSRSYLYRIINRRADLARDRTRAWRLAAPLDAGLMHEAAQALVGRHDFTTFRDANCQADTPVKTLTSISVARQGEILVRLRSRTVRCARWWPLGSRPWQECWMDREIWRQRPDQMWSRCAGGWAFILRASYELLK